MEISYVLLLIIVAAICFVVGAAIGAKLKKRALYKTLDQQVEEVCDAMLFEQIKNKKETDERLAALINEMRTQILLSGYQLRKGTGRVNWDAFYQCAKKLDIIVEKLLSPQRASNND